MTRTTSSDRFEQGDLNRFDRFADEFGRVPNDAIGDARREILRRRLHFADHALGRGERIRARPLGDSEDQGFLAGQIAVDAIVVRAELDPPDIGNAREGAVGRRLDDDVGELLGVPEAALRFDVELKGRAIVVGRLADRAGGDLDILGAKSGDHLARGHPARRGAARVDPHPHRIVAAAEHLDVADAFDAGQPVADLAEV